MLGKFEVAATMPAVDLDRAVRFYTGTLGLKALDTNENAVLLGSEKGSKIFIYKRGATKADHTAATFFVDNLEAVVESLITRGVVLEQYDFGEVKTDSRGIIRTPGGQAAWLKDPEGNILALTSM